MNQPHQPRAGIGGCLAGKPLTISFRRTGTSSDLWISKFARDQAGSTRTDLADGQYTWIINCDKQHSIILVHEAKVAIITPISLAGTVPLMGFKKFPQPTGDFEFILNISCRKVLMFEDWQGTKSAGEVWLSESLGVVMRDVESTTTGFLTWEATTLIQEAPTDTSFEAPADYVKQRTAAISLPEPSI